ncbi:Polyphenol oxidase [Heracleum sosnowskyi]|uniref:Polyphenol oxidase n=1 Tax=Heracleum sosnowskyi TaxID=360622 RepID=A0AAD8GRL6_9APIA|nr:Polyphenol oxidase [Heracleum sosnowskyi]
MASIQLPTSSSNFYPKTIHTKKSSTSQFFVNYRKRKHALNKQKFSCRATKDSPGDQQDGNSSKTERSRFDRRDVLLGLGGLYGTTAVSKAAFAAPVEATNCGSPETLPSGANITKFVCPPLRPSPYNLPDYSQRTLRERPAAHCVDEVYIGKYKKAMRLMRALPTEDPHSLASQAAIHCAYCDSAYEMVGFPNFKMQVHNNWLFFPFHRWYLYFFEKILGKLIEDDTFALPYWNWDAGKPVPALFKDRDSPLYDKLRNEKHLLLPSVDLNYSKRNDSPEGDALTKCNNKIMHTQMVTGSKTPKLFFGCDYRAGDNLKGKGAGAIENQPHTQIHMWTGDPNQRYGEDMGRFYSAGRDPLFYSHHANVDRMWNIWKTLPGRNRKDIKDPDWLNSSFIFYDENKKLVTVNVGDCVDTKRMGYTYEDVEIPWLKFKPARKAKNPKRGSKPGEAIAAEMPNSSTPQVFRDASEVFPKVLDRLLKVTVPRPKKLRSKEEKEDEEEILVIEGIEYDGDEYIKFDVFLNAENEVESGPNNAEFAGSYSDVPSKEKDRVKITQSFGITDLLEFLDADGDDNVVVALVPRTGKGKVTIGGARIVLSSQ